MIYPGKKFSNSIMSSVHEGQDSDIIITLSELVSMIDTDWSRAQFCQ